MTKQEIESYLEQLNDELESISVKGEICLYGGAVMCLVYNARPLGQARKMLMPFLNL